MPAQQPVLIVLAGGASSRLWPLSDKSLLKFVPTMQDHYNLLQHHLIQCSQIGFDQAVIVAGPENENAIRALASQAGGDVEVFLQPEASGQGDAILRAEPYLKAHGYPPIYVTQANDVLDPNLHQTMLARYQAGSAQAYLAGYQVGDYFPGGYMVVGDDDRLTGLIEKPGAGNEPSDLVSVMARLHVNTQTLLADIRQLYEGGHDADDHYEFAMSRQMDAIRYEAVRYEGPWHAIKYPWHVLDMMDYFLGQIPGQHISPEASVAESAYISGKVIIAPGARVFHTASIVGPAYIGPGAIVGNGALVRESMVGARCAVGHTSEVARSYLADGCQLHRAVVLDSVFDENVNFSAGCVTANLRWDRGPVKSTIKGERINTGRDKLGLIAGRDAFIGINAGTMPGVKIGKRAVVGPLTNANRDIPDDTLFYAEQANVEKTLNKGI